MACTKIAPGIYSIDSFNDETVSYRVDLNSGTCSCPHYTKRLAGTSGQCKHQKAAAAHRFQQIEETAKSLSTERLEELKDKYFGKDGKIWLAIKNELWTRYHTETVEQLRADRVKAEEQTRQRLASERARELVANRPLSQDELKQIFA